MNNPEPLERTYTLPLSVRIATYHGKGILLVGARCAGKTTLREQLVPLNSKYYDVLSIAPRRQTREGEGLAAVRTSVAGNIDRLVDHNFPFALAYEERDQFYAYPLDHFEEGKIPIVRIIGEEGLRMILKERTMPNMLRVHLTLDPSEVTDLEQRIISRLVRKEKLPKDFERDSADAAQLDLINSDLAYITRQVEMFKGSSRVFDVTYCNSALLNSDPRRHLYSDENPERIVTTDIAMRLNALYRGWDTRNSGRRPSVINITHEYLNQILSYLFGRSAEDLNPSTRLIMGKTTVERYAEGRTLNVNPLLSTMKETVVEHIDADESVLRIYLKPHSEGPAYVRDAENKSNLDFECLGLIARRVEWRADNNRTNNDSRIRPRFITFGNQVFGLEWSLSDTPPNEPKTGKYTRLELRYKYK